MHSHALSVLASCLLLVASLQADTGRALQHERKDREFIGWSGETFHPVKNEQDVVWVETLSWKPRAFLYHNFLTAQECAHLINLAKPHMHKSQVVDSSTGKSVDSQVRTSTGHFLRRAQDDVVRRIEERIAEMTKLPVEHGEALHILHYGVGEKYEAHYDYFHDSVNTRNGGQRLATVLLYLSDVASGGETTFPHATAQAAVSDSGSAGTLSSCGRHGLAVKPKRGAALLFYSLTVDNQLDTSSLHSGCPVLEGNKWSATKWIRASPYKS